MHISFISIKCNSGTYSSGIERRLEIRLHYPKIYICRQKACAQKFFESVSAKLLAKSPIQLKADDGRIITFFICTIEFYSSK